ncbi:MAG: hypothetical protein PVI90_15650, partial [Desulfobacteraceae bacterium]|jgi:hypothetical protein
LKNGKELFRCKTDCFGDFKFDNLAPQSGDYTLRVQSGKVLKEIFLSLKKSVNLGTIHVSKY